MKREGFLKLLDGHGYKYEVEGDKIIITHYTNIGFEKVRTLPDNVVFLNSGNVYLNDLESISSGVQFRNRGSVNLMQIKIDDLRPGVFMNGGSLWTEEFNNIHWQCDILDIRKGKLLNVMIKRGII